MSSKQKFEFSPAKNELITDDMILDDLKNVVQKFNVISLTQKIYTQYGQYDCTTVSRRFGTWNKALKLAGLQLSNEVNISDERLFKNLLNLWEHLGKQPTRRDLDNKISEFSQSPYNRRFKSWTDALKLFVIWANDEELSAPKENQNLSEKPKNGRDVSLRLRFQVLRRDNFACVQCGASPAKNPSVELHIDHSMPWSKGGDTVYENLQTLCSKCNLGKSNL